MVKNSAGIHVRPSGVIRKAFESYPGKITLTAKGMDIELRSTLGLIALGLQQNDSVSIVVEGPSEDTICADLIALLEKRYDFSQKK